MNNDINNNNNLQVSHGVAAEIRTRKTLPKARNLSNASWAVRGGAGAQLTQQNTCYCKTTIPFTCG